jgi:hypothetical protein
MLAHDLPHVSQRIAYQYTRSTGFRVSGIETAAPFSIMSADVPLAFHAGLDLKIRYMALAHF